MSEIEALRAQNEKLEQDLVELQKALADDFATVQELQAGGSDDVQTRAREWAEMAESLREETDKIMSSALDLDNCLGTLENAELQIHEVLDKLNQEEKGK
jgi:prefoldin subunit 5